MTDHRGLVEREVERVKLRPFTLDGFYRRRDRKRRNQRIATAATALILATVAIGGAAEIFLRSEGTRPANGITRQNVSDLALAWTGQANSIAAGGGNPAPTPVVHDGVVYVVSDGLYAFPASCGGGPTCEPLWTSWSARATDAPVHSIATGPPPAFGEGDVFMLGRSIDPGSGPSTPGGWLFAYPTACGESGSTCQARWSAQIDDGQLAGPLFADGQVFVASSTGHLYAFDEACGSSGSACQPAWVGEMGQGGFAGPLAAADGYVVVGEGLRLFAFASSCQTSTCAPVWSADLGTPGPWGVKAVPNLAIADGVVYAPVMGPSGTRLLAAFPLACGSSGPTCDALKVWSGLPAGVAEHVVVADGRVLVAEDGLQVFDANCGSGDCTPLWSAKLAASDNVPVAADGMVFVNGPQGLEAFPIDCAPAGDRARRCAPAWVAPSVDTGSPDSHTELPVVSDGLVFVGPENGHTVFAFATTCRTDGGTCQPLWTGTTHGVIRSSPVVSGDTLFIGTGDGKIVAFGLGGSSGGSGSSLPLALGLVILLGIGVFAALVARRRGGA